MFAPGHQPLVDDFGRIVSSGVNVHAFFHNRVASRAQCLACLISAWLDLGLLRLRGKCARPSSSSHCGSRIRVKENMGYRYLDTVTWSLEMLRAPVFRDIAEVWRDGLRRGVLGERDVLHLVRLVLQYNEFCNMNTDGVL